MKYESLVIWGRQQCNGAKARKKKIYPPERGRAFMHCMPTHARWVYSTTFQFSLTTSLPHPTYISI